MMQNIIDKTFDNEEPWNFKDPAYYLSSAFYSLVEKERYSLGIYEDEIVDLIFKNQLLGDFFRLSTTIKSFLTISDIQRKQERILLIYPIYKKNY